MATAKRASDDARQGDLPPSGLQHAALPQCTSRMIETALAIDPAAPLERSIASLLEVVCENEPHAVVAVALAGGTTICRSADDRAPAPEARGERLFPSLDCELHAPLPDPLQGSVHLAADAFDALSPTTAAALLDHLAGLVALLAREAVAHRHARELGQHVAQLEKLAAIGRTAAGIVHELNNPLTAIIAYSDYLERKLREGDVDDTDLDRLGRIHEAANRIQRFSRDLVDYSRPASDLRMPVDMRQVIDRALGFCVHGLRRADITVERSYGEIPMIEGVESPLTQVFVNLVTNAGHAMSETGGTLRLATAERAGQVLVEVADEGTGIAPENLPRVFDSYFTTKPRGQGAGLGLSIVRQIIQDHGGTVRAENRTPRGTVFYIELPVR